MWILEKSSTSENTPQSIDSPHSAAMSDTPRHDDDGSWVSSPKDSVFPETIPEEASSIEEERVVILNLQSTPNSTDPSFYTVNIIFSRD